MEVSTIRSMRMKLDEKITAFVILQKYHFTKEGHGRSATQALMLARMWMGKLLGVLGEPNPYPNSMEPNDIVEPPADVAPGQRGVLPTAADEVLAKVNAKGPLAIIEYLKMQRADVDEMIFQWQKPFTAAAEGSFDTPPETAPLEFLCIERIYGYLTEGKMWLGMEMEAYDRYQKEIERELAVER